MNWKWRSVTINQGINSKHCGYYIIFSFVLLHQSHRSGSSDLFSFLPRFMCLIFPSDFLSVRRMSPIGKFIRHCLAEDHLRIKHFDFYCSLSVSLDAWCVKSPSQIKIKGHHCYDQSVCLAMHTHELQWWFWPLSWFWLFSLMKKTVRNTLMSAWGKGLKGEGNLSQEATCMFTFLVWILQGIGGGGYEALHGC